MYGQVEKKSSRTTAAMAETVAGSCSGCDTKRFVRFFFSVLQYRKNGRRPARGCQPGVFFSCGVGWFSFVRCNGGCLLVSWFFMHEGKINSFTLC